MSTPPGSFVWNELMTRDPEAAARFYGAVLGWTVKAWHTPGEEDRPPYHLWIQEGDDQPEKGGMMKMDGPDFTDVPPHWMAYVKVANLKDTVAKVATQGGTVLLPPLFIPEVGDIAVFRDPEGAVLGLLQPVGPCV